MKRALGRFMLWTVVALPLASTACAADGQTPLRELPPLLRAVSDEPGVLSLAEGRALSRRIAEIEHATGVKLVALVVATVAPESVEAYVHRLIDHWKRFSRALDNERFVFVVVAKSDRELRIVPGKPLAWVLKPLTQSEVAVQATGLLKQDKYFEALTAIAEMLARLIADQGSVVQRPMSTITVAAGCRRGSACPWTKGAARERAEHRVFDPDPRRHDPARRRWRDRRGRRGAVHEAAELLAVANGLRAGRMTRLRRMVGVCGRETSEK